MKKLKLFFCGTPAFSIPTLKSLHKNSNVEIIQVITPTPKPQGRGKKIISPPVAQFALENDLNLFKTDNMNKEVEFLEKLKNQKPDLGIVFAFSQFLCPEVLNIARIGTFNLHASLLPKYRGASPIHYSLINNDTETGMSIQKMVKEMDAGPIALKKKISIVSKDNFVSLSQKLMDLSCQIIDQFIDQCLENKINLIEQNHQEKSFAPKIKNKDGLLDFKNETYQQIKGKMRAFCSWPGTFCRIEGKRVKILEARNYPQLSLNAEQSKIENNRLLIGCKDSCIEVLKLQIEGKRPQSILDFINGVVRGKKELNINS